MSAHPRVTLNNPELLRWARTTAGLSPAEVASRVGTSLDAVVRWEDGKGAPTFHQLEKFAKAVHRSVAALYLPEPPEEAGPPRDFRGARGIRRGHFSPKALLCFRQLRNALGGLREILPLLGLSVHNDLPFVPDGGADPAEAAEEVRGLLGVPLSRQMAWGSEWKALDEWRSVLFDHGVLVQQFPLDPEKEARGFSVYEGDLSGIGVSSKDAPVARIFSIFHEVGHLLLHEPGVSGDTLGVGIRSRSPEARVEQYCNAFAAALLLPIEEKPVLHALQELANDLSHQTARRLARRFWVSKPTLAIRGVQAGLIAQARYDKARRDWQKIDRDIAPRGRPDQATQVISRHGKRFAELVLEAVEQSALGEVEAARMLGVRPAALDDTRMALA